MTDIRENRWLKVIYTVSLICMGIAFVLFLGQVLNRFQPFFSIAVIIVCLIWIRSYFLRAFKLLKASKTHRSYIDHLLHQGFISCGMLGASITVLFLKGTMLYWAALGFFSLGVGAMIFGGVLVLRLGIRDVLRGILMLRYSVRELSSAGVPDDTELAEQEEQEKATTMAGLVVGMIVVALAYLLVFAPLTVWVAHSRGLDVINVLLFVNFSGISISHGFWQELARLVAPGNAPFLFSFGVLYGVVAFCFVLLRTSIRGAQWGEFIVTSNGILLGYVLTLGVSYLLGITETFIHASRISFAYVFVVMYVSRVLTIEVSRWGIKAKYQYAIGGIQGITVAWILSRIFGAESVVFTGLIFYICTFVTTSLFEIFFTWLFGTAVVEEAMSLKSNLWQTIRFAGREYWKYAVSVAVIGSAFPLITYGLLKLVTDAMLA